MQLQEPTFYDFCSKFQKAVQEGWGVSTDTDKIPCTIGNQFFAFLVKDVPVKAAEEVKVEAPKPATKKAKA